MLALKNSDRAVIFQLSTEGTVQRAGVTDGGFSSLL